MKKVYWFIMIFLLATSTANAIPYTVTDTTTFYKYSTGADTTDLNYYGGQYVNKLEGLGDYVSWTHQYEFNPEAISLTSATLTLSFSDDGGWFDFCEFALGWTESGHWAWGEIDTGEYEYDLSLNGLDDGAYKITVISLGGDFYINSSELAINYEGAAPVPEPATMLLFGTGLVGLAGISRRKIYKK